jgi:hypothetical protein
MDGADNNGRQLKESNAALEIPLSMLNMEGVRDSHFQNNYEDHPINSSMLRMGSVRQSSNLNDTA